MGTSRSCRKLRAGVVTRSSVALPEMVGESAGMGEMARMVRLVAPRSTTVLIEGETGTGKELVAQAMHRLSARQQAVCGVELRGDSGVAAGGRVVWAYARGVYRGGAVADGKD